MLNTLEEIKEQKYSSVGVVTLRNDKILTFEPLAGKTTHTLEDMKIELAYFEEWTKQEKMGFLSDNRNLKKFDSEIRIYAQKHLPFFCNKFAMIISSGISSFLTNMFIHLNRPEVPVRVFTSKEKAILWLKEN